MCGIAGIWNRSGRPVEGAALDRVGAVLRHRGPDGTGSLLRGEIGFVHRRLTIVDLSDAGRQPMTLPDGSLWINYNGEIHNYRELRSELEDAGAVFHSRCDTEVALWAYRIWGAGCFERFNGMWALALWDARAGELVLSRDRFGIKPLCYAVDGDRIAFASEPKAILAAFPEEREPDHREIHAFLAGGFPDIGEATFFRNIRALTPATCVTFRRDGHRHWSYWRFVPGEEKPCADAEERFRGLLEDSVRLRMRSDVPVGAAVSGGLDSSAVVRLAARHTSDPIECFSVRYDDDPDADESRYATAALDDPRKFRVHWIRPDPDGMLDIMSAIVWHHDAPTPLRGRYPQWFVMREAGRHVKVILEGSGSDEQLAGYGRFASAYLLDRLRGQGGARPSPSSLYRDAAALAAVGGSGPIATVRSLATAVRHRFGLGEDSARQVCRPDFCAAFGPVSPKRFVETWLRRDADRPFRSHLNNALWIDFRHVGLPETLHSVDALSMAFSVESRPPFLDHRLVELSFSLPPHEKMRDGWTKSILRRALHDVLPEEIRTRRRKLGFPAPIGRWLQRPSNLRQVEDLLLDPRCLGRGILDARILRRKIETFKTSTGRQRAAFGPLLWRWVTLELWFRQFVDAPVGAPGEARERATLDPACTP
jgi:asparagine synthase (glutamine-hydrolysing)